jgi:exosortase A-associated hydrolase 1
MSFACEGATLIGTVDEAVGDTGVLIVSGGNEIRCGAHRGMALLARRLADAGVPVFRFDRRGVGDSEGENGGYAASRPDIVAALAAFRREQPQLKRIIGFGNCDAATALATFDHGCDALVLANPWLGDEAAALPPAAARAHYLRQLRDPRVWPRLLSRGLFRRLASMVGRGQEQPLVATMAAALARQPATLVLAEHDRTAQVFAAAVRMPDGMPVTRVATASHSFAGHDDALAHTILDAIATLQEAGE